MKTPIINKNNHSIPFGIVKEWKRQRIVMNGNAINGKYNTIVRGLSVVLSFIIAVYANPLNAAEMIPNNYQKKEISSRFCPESNTLLIPIIPTRKKETPIKIHWSV